MREWLEYSAFVGCDKLTSVSVPSGVRNLEYKVFKEVTNITQFYYDRFFIYGDNEERILLNSSKTKLIGYPNKFSKAHYKIPKSIKIIGENAFSNSNNLLKIKIHKNVMEIGSNAFSQCTSLIFIEVEEENLKYSSIDGVLFNKEKTELIFYPPGRKELSYIIPSGVKAIVSDAFYRCVSLARVTIPDTLSNISNYAFSENTSLEEIIVENGNSEYSSAEGVLFNKQKTKLIRCPARTNETDYIVPKSVEHIGRFAFNNCKNIS